MFLPAHAAPSFVAGLESWARLLARKVAGQSAEDIVMSIATRFAVGAVGGGLLVVFSALTPAAAYDDVPDFNYAAPPPTSGTAVYGYGPVMSGPRVYGYGPVYRQMPSASTTRDRTPLGTYVPNDQENLSAPRDFYRGLERQSGG